MRLFNRMAASRISILCEIMEKGILIRRVGCIFCPSFDYQWGITQLKWTCKSLRFMYCWVNKDILKQKKMFNFLPQKLMVRGDPSYKNDILDYFTQYANFRGCHSVEQPHLPNCTWFWIINMPSIAVEPSTNGQYGGLEPNWAFYPPYWVPVHPLTLCV